MRRSSVSVSGATAHAVGSCHLASCSSVVIAQRQDVACASFMRCVVLFQRLAFHWKITTEDRGLYVLAMYRHDSDSGGASTAVLMQKLRHMPALSSNPDTECE